MVTTSLCLHILLFLLLLCLLRGLRYLCSSSDSLRPLPAPVSLSDPLLTIVSSFNYTISLGRTLRRCHHTSSSELDPLRRSGFEFPRERLTRMTEKEREKERGGGGGTTNEKEEGRPRSGHCCQACLSFSHSLSLSLSPALLLLHSLSSVFHVGYAQAALPMPLTLVKPTVCMNRCSTALLPLQRPLCRCSLRFSFVLFFTTTA